MSVKLQNESEKFCLFRVGSCLFAFPAAEVVEVASNPVVVAVPGTPTVLEGVCHLRNEFVPVLQLAALTGDIITSSSAARQVIIINATKGNWSLVVDRVVGLETLEVVTGRETQFAEGWMSAVLGSATFQQEIVRILSPNAVYRLAERVMRQATDLDPSVSTQARFAETEGDGEMTEAALAQETIQ